VLLLAWLPVIGDPLCLLAGVLRVEPVRFVVLVGLGKLARYAFIAWAFACLRGWLQGSRAAFGRITADAGQAVPVAVAGLTGISRQ
jgi:hypothetical protein